MPTDRPRAGAAFLRKFQADNPGANPGDLPAPLQHLDAARAEVQAALAETREELAALHLPAPDVSLESWELLGRTVEIDRRDLDTMSGEQIVLEARAWAARKQALAAYATGPTAQPEPQQPKRPPVDEWLSRAMILVRDHPERSDAAIAAEVGRHPAALCRRREYKLAAKLARGDKTSRPSGYVVADAESGERTTEAVARPCLPDDRADRGQPVKGSKFFREYCADCEEPIKVPQAQIGKNPLCQRCQPG